MRRRKLLWEHGILTGFSVLAFLSLTACDRCSTQSTKSDAQVTASTNTEDVIRIGEVGSLTGSEATFGVSTHRGIELAMSEINEAGGVKGKKLTLTTIDDQGKPDEAATAITKLITQNNVTAVLGEVASSRSLAMAPIAQNHKIPMISPSSTNPKVTEQGDFIFRVCFIDPFQGAAMAKFSFDHLKSKKASILRDIKSDYSMGLADSFEKTFKALGGEILTDISYSSGDIDFKSQLTKIRAKIDEQAKGENTTIFVPGYYTEVGLIARQSRELGITSTLLGGDGWDSKKLKEIGGTSIEGSYFSNHYSPEDKAPNVVNFTTKYNSIYHEVPDSLAAMGYDALKVLADAMNRSKTLNPVDIREAISQTKDFQGVTDKISIDANRNAVKSAVILHVDKGQFKFFTTVSPQSIQI